MSDATATANKPIKVLKAGVHGLSASIWQNESKKEGNRPYLTVSLNRTYKDKSDEFQTQTISLTRDAVLALGEFAGGVYREMISLSTDAPKQEDNEFVR